MLKIPSRPARAAHRLTPQGNTGKLSLVRLTSTEEFSVLRPFPFPASSSTRHGESQLPYLSLGPGI